MFAYYIIFMHISSSMVKNYRISRGQWVKSLICISHWTGFQNNVRRLSHLTKGNMYNLWFRYLISHQCFISNQVLVVAANKVNLRCTVETLYSTIYYSKYFIELNFDKSTQYVALWTHKRHPIPRPFGRAMECLLWVFQQKLTVL